MSVESPAKAYTISFGPAGKPPVRLPEGSELSSTLDATNSPLLFGCRTGICGTCASRVRVVSGELPPVSDEERETLSAVCPGVSDARLACQIRACADLEIRPVEK